MPQGALLSWVWRIPFLASIVLIAVAVFIRLRLKESPTFVKLEKQEQIAAHPLRDVFSSSFPTVLRGIGLRMAENGGSYIYQTLAITYVTKLGVQSSIGPLAVVVIAISYGIGVNIMLGAQCAALPELFGSFHSAEKAPPVSV